MAQTVTLDQLPAAIDRIVNAAMWELATAGKIEAGVECGDILADTQRYRTGRAAASTTVVGRRKTPHDPGPAPGDQLAFYLPASRTELMQSAEVTIPHDTPQDSAHVIEAAGVDPEGRPYPGLLERRFHAGRNAITKTEAKEAVIQRRADRRALRELRKRGIV